MKYPYRCEKCGHDFDVIKSVREIDNPESCKKCGSTAQRYIARGGDFYGANDWDKAEFNPAFGCVVKNRQHKRELLRKFAGEGKVFEEIGNEPVEKMHSHFEKVREERRNDRWREADRVKY